MRNLVAFHLLVSLVLFPIPLAAQVAGTASAELPTLTITVLVDNYTTDSRLKTEWGFAALVEFRDHTGGLPFAVGRMADPRTYLLSAFPAQTRRRIRELGEAVEVPAEGLDLAEGLHLTGRVPGLIPEQALVAETANGLVVLTGCAHPGIVKIVALARERYGNEVHLVIGGFHLFDQEATVDAIIAEFRRMGVQQVACTHCTGEGAIAAFHAAYGKDFLPLGSGTVIRVGGRK
jgi:7,8-dihydropterin-6-yl-methyl-4-(beta-D-ribofuranosyl)aminobenzene 5'-phosphate synthase